MMAGTFIWLRRRKNRVTFGVVDAEDIRQYCLQKQMVTEGFPFDSETLVFKVAGKMFALLALDAHPLRMNLKCDPERAVALREQHAAVLPGYHMNKSMWNTLVLDGSLTRKWVEAEIDHSYEEVVKTLPKKIRENL